ncbi:hypothetical protein ACHJH3_11030 [Campylobacter sp. MOP7]|uniref:hypothetical protein n=1 Tax=Campylobacter canis TaxID=3378588 RepID=UPI00387E7D67
MTTTILTILLTLFIVLIWITWTKTKQFVKNSKYQYSFFDKLAIFTEILTNKKYWFNSIEAAGINPISKDPIIKQEMIHTSGLTNLDRPNAEVADELAKTINNHFQLNIKEGSMMTPEELKQRDYLLNEYNKTQFLFKENGRIKVMLPMEALVFLQKAANPLVNDRGEIVLSSKEDRVLEVTDDEAKAIIVRENLMDLVNVLGEQDAIELVKIYKVYPHLNIKAMAKQIYENKVDKNKLNQIQDSTHQGPYIQNPDTGEDAYMDDLYDNSNSFESVVGEMDGSQFIDPSRATSQYEDDDDDMLSRHMDDLMQALDKTSAHGDGKEILSGADTKSKKGTKIANILDEIKSDTQAAQKQSQETKSAQEENKNKADKPQKTEQQFNNKKQKEQTQKQQQKQIAGTEQKKESIPTPAIENKKPAKQKEQKQQEAANQEPEEQKLIIEQISAPKGLFEKDDYQSATKQQKDESLKENADEINAMIAAEQEILKELAEQSSEGDSWDLEEEDFTPPLYEEKEVILPAPTSKTLAITEPKEDILNEDEEDEEPPLTKHIPNNTNQGIIDKIHAIPFQSLQNPPVISLEEGNYDIYDGFANAENTKPYHALYRNLIKTKPIIKTNDGACFVVSLHQVVAAISKIYGSDFEKVLKEFLQHINPHKQNTYRVAQEVGDVLEKMIAYKQTNADMFFAHKKGSQKAVKFLGWKLDYNKFKYIFDNEEVSKHINFEEWRKHPIDEGYQLFSGLEGVPSHKASMLYTNIDDSVFV